MFRKLYFLFFSLLFCFLLFSVVFCFFRCFLFVYFQRTSINLQHKYDNTKRQLRKMHGDERRECMKTGGGANAGASKVTSEALQSLLAVIGTSVKGLPSRYDNDNLTLLQNTENTENTKRFEYFVRLFSSWFFPKLCSYFDLFLVRLPSAVTMHWRNSNMGWDW